MGSALLSVLGVTWVGAGDVADVVALRLMAYAAWLYGLVGLPALLKRPRDADPTFELARLRGAIGMGAGARAVGLTVRLTAGLWIAALPGIALSAFVSESPSAFSARGLLFLASAGYLLALGASLGLVGVVSEKLLPRAPRVAAWGLVLVPFALSLLWSDVPSVPGAFLWAFRRLVAWGGYFA